MKKRAVLLYTLSTIAGWAAQHGGTDPAPFVDLNKPERVQWLGDAGFGMFVHFSFDSQLGVVISHSLVGASDDYTNRFFHDLPQTFDPKRFDARELVTLAKLAGMKYIVLTAKHHSGFCLWDTKTTDFNIMRTPYGKDLVAQFVAAAREAGLGVGLYYSPEDFWFLHQEGQLIRRDFPEPIPAEVQDRYVDFVARQCAELMTNYGPIDVVFFDGGDGRLQEKAKEVVWKLQPNALVTRGAMRTPEQMVPGQASDVVFEANITMGTQWQYKPTNEDYKSGTRLIDILIETRAKGGALLMNVGPKPDGVLPEEQEARLREIAAWHFVNQEAVHGVRPWILTNEDNIWFTRGKDDSTVFAYLTGIGDWARGARKEFLLKSVKSTPSTRVSVLGQSDRVVEYDAAADATTRFEQREDGLLVSCVRAQRIYNNHKWPNPIVLKLENVVPALDPPLVQTVEIRRDGAKLKLVGEVTKSGDVKPLTVGFYFRKYGGFVEQLYSTEWMSTAFVEPTAEGRFEIAIDAPADGEVYQFKAAARNARIEVHGDIVQTEIEQEH